MTGYTEFAVAVESVSPERAVVRVTGDLDMSTAEDVEGAIASLPATSALVIDLSACTFLDSAGIRVLTASINDDRRVSLVTVDPGILRLLEITALDTLVDVRPSLDDATT